MLKYFMILVAAMCCVSCKDKNTPPLKFSTRQIETTAVGGEYNVTITGGDWWLRPNVMIDGKIVYSDELKVTYEGEGNKKLPVKVEGVWFTILQKDKKTLYVKIAENNTNKNRILLIFLQHLDYFPDIRVTQKGK